MTEYNEDNPAEEIKVTTLVKVEEPPMEAFSSKLFIVNRYSAISHMENIFGVQSPSGHEYAMIKFITDRVNRMIKKSDIPITMVKDAHGNIMVTKGVLEAGEYYPCLAAHMDKVHRIKNKYKVNFGTLTTTKEEILWATCESKLPKRKYEDCGGCGDDGGGIYVALEGLKHLPKLKAVFFVEEEIGGKGANKIDLEFFKDCGYILEGDRRGKGDLIQEYSWDYVVSKDFLNKIKPVCEEYKFSKANGTFTDVMALAERGVNISVMNFSVGYYNAHTDNEYTVVDELINSTEFALNLITHLGNNRFYHEYESKYYRSYANDHYYGFKKYRTYDSSYKKDYYKEEREYYDAMYGFGAWDDLMGDHEDYRNKNKSKELDADTPNDTFDINTAEYYRRESIFDEEIEGCICSDTHIYLNAVDLQCEICNPIITLSSHKFCDCGEELVERQVDYFCVICQNSYIKA